MLDRRNGVFLVLAENDWGPLWGSFSQRLRGFGDLPIFKDLEVKKT